MNRLDLLKKLKVVAQRGEDGEAANAKELLTVLMLKHGITESDLEEEVVNEYFWSVSQEVHIKLLSQIIHHINPKLDVYSVNSKNVKKFNLKGNVFTECTAAEFVVADQMYSHYKPLFDAELGIFFGGFIRANKLTVKASDSDKDLTEEEIRDYLRQLEMAGKIRSESFRRQLTG